MFRLTIAWGDQFRKVLVPRKVIDYSYGSLFIVSAWRRRALETFPELRAELECSDATIYELFFSLLPWCRDAHTSGDDAALSRIYGFAEWCARQPEKELWNAAGVAFYEHLGDSPVTLAEIPKWVPDDVFEDIAELLAARIGRDEVTRLRRQYGSRSTLLGR